MSACLRKLPVKTVFNLSVVTPRRLNCVHVTQTPSCRGATHRQCRQLLKNACVCVSTQRVPVRWKSNSDDKDISSLIQPIPVKPCADPDGINVGEELTGTLKKGDLLKLLNQFYRRTEIKRLAAENGLDDKLFHQAYVNFRRYCVESDTLPVDLHVILSDILQEAGHVDDIFPYFVQHARVMFPHLDCMEDLRKISDLRHPANWYPEARAIQRKIIYHSGPTNSGKTYHALERFLSAKSGVYCGPLRLLANEVFNKSNTAGTPCDLVTGEERRYVDPENEPSGHVACTVEMTSVTTPYEVAVIDEIQMMRDNQRGWAWTRALLGACAYEVHVCGEASCIDLVKDLALITGDEVEVRKYKRLTPLKVLNEAVGSFDRVKPGDCIVCFGKNDIYHVSRQLERRGMEVAVIYGTLPPGTKLAQAQKFNDPDNPCKVLVATDAIGMGLNLNIKRVIFYSVVKPTINEKGEKEIDVIPPSTALQIGGRAGRYGTKHEEGEVTTFKSNDLPLLRKLLSTPIDPVEQAGIHPTAEQIELFAYHLPKATLSNLIDIFVTLSELDNDRYFMCHIDDFKFLADMIEHVPLQLRVRYVFCCAPIMRKQPFVCTMFLKYARQCSRGEPLTLDWLCRQLGWPFMPPQVINDLVHLENVFDVLDLYMWLSYRFIDLFPDVNHVRDMQAELDQLIQVGVYNITRLLRNSETAISTGTLDSEDDFEVRRRTQKAEQTHDDDFDDTDDADVKSRKHSLSAEFKNARRSQVAGGSRVGGNGGHRLADQLVKQGLLTRDMLDRLRDELTEDERTGRGHGRGGNNNNPGQMRRK
ncbi:ATP-dependent RNA helicase SUPV3L1, mitochondrial [Lamellibrachia satsuma]|nr:ATP-dependent RNA helicase SUPV3L1, mitochondrial [Lamellibrachia satsuma]